jgi:hypothetical protein
MVSDATAAAGVARNTFYNWLNANTDFATAFDELEREILDRARRCWQSAFYEDWKAAEAYLKKYDRPHENKPERQVLIVEGDEIPERLKGG